MDLWLVHFNFGSIREHFNHRHFKLVQGAQLQRVSLNFNTFCKVVVVPTIEIGEDIYIRVFQLFSFFFVFHAKSDNTNNKWKGSSDQRTFKLNSNDFDKIFKNFPQC